MKLADVVDYVEAKTGVKRSRATIYNWATKGVGPDCRKLQTEIRAGQMFTTAEWVDEFLSHMDMR